MDTPPRYRIEHRDGDLPPLIVAWADLLTVAHLAVATKRLTLGRRGIAGDLAIVDQETETDVKTFPIAPE